MTSSTPEISLDQLESALRENATVIDVREPGEYAEAHVPGARLVPMASWAPARRARPRPRRCTSSCAAGNRSAAMTDLLTATGHDAYSVTGGTTAGSPRGAPSPPAPSPADLPHRPTPLGGNDDHDQYRPDHRRDRDPDPR